ncbi:MAG: M20 aminoacylase family protein [Rhodospirillales bacterium]|jgi:hippurate hydrolase
MPINNRIAAFHADMTEWRRDIHAHPELGFEEVRTAGIVAAKLRDWGIEVHEGIAKTGVVGVLKGRTDASGRAVGLRADMDALPMSETTGAAHASQNPGRMHACGHDGHTTMLLGAARYLAETRNFDGTVYFVFQPAEEGRFGAKVMMDEGLFARFPMEQVYGMHNWPELPAGEVAAVAGPVMAAADRFDITIRGTGGHGAMPHRSVDPVLVASHIVTAMQSIVARNADPMHNAVVSVTQIHSGTAYNVIPEEATLAGTVRTYLPEVQDMIIAHMERIATSVAAAFGATAEVVYHRGYPATVNHAAETDVAAAAAARVVGEGAVKRDLPPCMGAEDFSYMLEARPGSYLWLGGGRGPDTVAVHNPGYDFNDEILPVGASIWAQIVETVLPRRD